MTARPALAAAALLSFALASACLFKEEGRYACNERTGEDCGSDGGVDAGEDAGISFEAFCDEYARRACEQWARCGASGSDAGWCVPLVRAQQCGAADSVRRGFSSFDRAEAERCLSEFDTLGSSCTRGACGPLLPLSHAGEGCQRDSDCADPGYGCGGGTCSGVCVLRGAIGGPCVLGGCPRGGYCDRGTDTCVPYKSPGASCVEPFLATECDPATAYCDAGSCVLLPSSGPCAGQSCADVAYCGADSNCHPRVDAGASCSNGEGCTVDAYCANNLCVPLKPDGAGCGSAFECASGGCIDKVCAPLRDIGQSCTTRADCGFKLECDSVLHQCQPSSVTLAVGTACTNDVLRCDPKTAYCAGALANADGGVGTAGECVRKTVGMPCTPGAFGECPIRTTCVTEVSGTSASCQLTPSGGACGTSVDCVAAEYCDGGACVNRIQQGLLCPISQFPLDSACLPPSTCRARSVTDSTGVCGPRAEVGSPCFRDSDCAVLGVCSNGVCTLRGVPGFECISPGTPFANCYVGVCGNDGGTCLEPLPRGVACSADTQCSSLVCDSLCVDRCE